MDKVKGHLYFYKDDSIVTFYSEITESFKHSDKCKYYDEEIKEAL